MNATEPSTVRGHDNHYVSFEDYEHYDVDVLPNFKGSFTALAGHDSPWEENALEADPWPMAKRESHHMCIFVFWFCAEDMPHIDNVYEHVPIMCCPCYQFVWFFGAAFIWLGCWIHTPFGQGGKTRKDETKLEACVRKQWIYMCDGLYGILLAGDLLEFFFEGVTDGLAWRSDGECGALCYLIAAGIYFILMAGNFIFISAMQNKMEVRLRSCIIGNLTFGTLVLIALLASAIGGHGTTHGNTPFLQGFIWTFRTGVVLCYVLVGLFYTQLWNVYHKDAVDGNMHSAVWWDATGDGKEDDFATHMEHCSICRAVGPSLMCIAVSIWLFAYHPDSVWSALAA